MKKFKGTKGEWVLSDNKHTIKTNGKLMVTVWSSRKECEDREDGESWLSMRKRTETDRIEIEKEREANAKLIAAAPLLLEALQNIENDDGSIPATIWKLRNDAINKALGDE
jgi:hypothetical protein